MTASQLILAPATLAELRLGGAGYWGMAVAAILAALAFWLYRRQLPADTGTLRRVLLPSLRAAAVAAVALILAQPSLHHSRTHEQRGQVIVIADTSASMEVTDPQADAAHKILSARALGLTDTTGIDWTLHELADRIAELRRRLLEMQDAPGVERAPLDLGGEASAIAEAISTLDPGVLSEAQLSGSVVMETWYDVPGRSLGDIVRLAVFDRPANATETVTSLQLPTDSGDNFVRRIRGRLHPPETGSYTFHLSADTAAELFLAREEGGGPRSILVVSQRTESEDLSTTAGPVTLEAGQAYPFELHHREGEHTDHLTLAWSRDGAAPAVIAGGDLSSPAALLDPDRRRDELAQAFGQQVARRIEELESLPAAEREERANAVAEDLAEFEAELRTFFDAYAEGLLASGHTQASAAAAAFDGMSRSGRLARLLDPAEPLPGLAEALADHADTEFRTTALDRARPASGPSETASGGTGTDLAAALAAVQPDENRPQAVVLLSDGRHNAATPPAEVAASLGRRGVAIHTVLVGSPKPPPDVAVLEVVGPTAVHKEDQVTGRIVLQDAMPPGKPFALKIMDGERTLWEESLETTGRGRREIEFTFDVDEIAEARLPDEPGEGGARMNELLLPLRVEASAVDGEMQENNNSGDLPVRVTLATGRLLIIDGRPRWETRYLASLLGRDRRWEVTEVLGPLTDGRAEAMARGSNGFPVTREALYEYDVIVLGEVPVDWWRDEELQWLADFVDERGGGLIIVDGLRGLLQAYAATPVNHLLPVMRESGMPLAPSSLTLTAAGQQRDALRLEPEAARNTELWPTLPAPRWIMPTSALPAAEVLVEAVTEDGTRLPAIVFAQVGRGRVWYQAFDETWRWRKEAESRWQARYWSGVANRIMEPPFAAEDRFVSIGVEQAAISVDDPVGVRVRFRDREGRILAGDEAAAVTATAVLLKDGVRVSEARLVPDSSGGGLFRAQLGAPAEPGVYEVAVEADGYSDSDFTARASLLVRDEPATAGGELARLDADESLMRQLATGASGGRFLHEHEAPGALPELLSGLHRSRTVTTEYDIWTSWPLFGAAIGLLTLEWLIRRRSGLH